jgi:rubrerythrin
MRRQLSRGSEDSLRPHRRLATRLGAQNAAALFEMYFRSEHLLRTFQRLRDRLEHIGKINTGYTKVFACRVCGQRWEEDAVQRGQGESPQVAKQGFSWYDTRLKPP